MSENTKVAVVEVRLKATNVTEILESCKEIIDATDIIQTGLRTILNCLKLEVKKHNDSYT